MIAVLVLFLFFDVFSGVLRYAFFQLELPFLIYLPQVAMLAVLMFTAFRMEFDKYVVSILIFLVFFTLYGFITVGKVSQVLFGLWILIPFLYGLILHEHFLRSIPRLKFIFFALFTIVFVGVALDTFVDLPWSGFSYTFGETEIEGARKWGTYGIERVAGFSRASFFAAIQTLIIGLLIVVSSSGRLRPLVICLLAGIAIALTTTKGVAFVYVLLCVFMLGYSLRPMFSWQYLIWPFAFSTILIPLTTFIYHYRLDLQDPVSAFLFVSFEDRLIRGWPDAFQLLSTHGNYLLGRGVGGIGTPQLYFENNLYSPGDNLFVYLFVSYGIISIGGLCLYSLKACQQDIAVTINRYFYMIAFSIVVFGLTSNVVESSMLSLFAGLSVAHFFKGGASNNDTISS